MRMYIKRAVVLTGFLLFPLLVYADNTGNAVYHPLITQVKGTVNIMGQKSRVWEPAEVGTLLLSGDTLKTGEDATAEIMFRSGRVQLYQNSLLIIPSTGVQDRKKDIKAVVVEKGSAFFDINPLGVRKEFQFRTRNVQGGVKGTRFTVSYEDDGTSVAVYRGKVVVSDLDRSEGTKRDLTAGRALRVEAKGKFEQPRGFNPDFDVDDYTYTVPPGLDSRGLPADYNSNPDNKGVRDRGKGGGRENAPGQENK